MFSNPWILCISYVDHFAQMLTHPPGSYKPISYEQMYSAVYKWVKKESEASSAGNQKPSILRCVCKQYSEILYRDLFNHMRCEIEIRHSCYIIRVHRVTQTISLYDSSPKNPPSPMVQSPQLCPRWNLHRRVPQGDNISSYLYHMVTRSFFTPLDPYFIKVTISLIFLGLYLIQVLIRH